MARMLMASLRAAISRAFGGGPRMNPRSLAAGALFFDKEDKEAISSLQKVWQEYSKDHSISFLSMDTKQHEKKAHISLTVQKVN